MARLFGTDGVRGLANGASDRRAGPGPVRRRGPRPGRRAVTSRDTGPVAVVGRDTRISGQFLEAAVVAGLASAGVDVLLLGVLPTPGVAYLTGVARRRPRRDALGLAQPDARQRHQVPRPRRAQARRRHRGRDRERHARAAGSARPAATSAGSRRTPTAVERVRRPPGRHHRPAAGRAQGRARLRRRRRLRGRPAGAARRRRRGDRDPRRARRPQHQRQLRLDPPRRRCRPPSSSTAPTPASPSTATPTAAWPSTPTATSSTATRSSRSSRSRCASRAARQATPSSRP